MNRPDDEIARAETVCPGLHRFDTESPEASYDVVWWDPAALHLRAEPPFGLRRQELISKDVAPDVVASRQRTYIEWRRSREEAIARGRTPSLQVHTATEWAAAAGPTDLGPEHGDARTPPTVEILSFDTHPGRPSGARYGTLVHAAIATVPLDADDEMLARVVRTQGRIVAAGDDEVASAIAVVRDVLAHPLLEAARRADRDGRCLRETPVTLTLDGVLIDGVLDFAFDTVDGGVTVIDFKTDRAEGARLERYRRQVGLYARAVAQATGRPARAVLMKV